jgi:hypothetical protein
MGAKLFQRYPLHTLVVLFLGLLVLIMLFPSGQGFADANLPTITPTSEPTATQQQNGQGQGDVPTSTPVPVQPSTVPELPAMATSVPPPTSVTGGLSLLNRILLVILAVVTVGVMGVIVYAIYYRTRREGSDF